MWGFGQPKTDALLLPAPITTAVRQYTDDSGHHFRRVLQFCLAKKLFASQGLRCSSFSFAPHQRRAKNLHQSVTRGWQTNSPKLKFTPFGKSQRPRTGRMTFEVERHSSGYRRVGFRGRRRSLSMGECTNQRLSN